MIDQFLKDVPRHITALETTLAQKDSDVLRQTAHALKGISKYMGATRLAEFVFDLEMLGKELKLEQARNVFTQIQQEIERVQTELRAEAFSVMK